MDNITRKFIRRNKKNKSRKIDYSKIAKELKGKTNFNIDLRKINSKKGTTTYNFGQRMALLKAAKAYTRFINKGTFIEIKRQKNESKTAFKQRVRNTKEDMGQKDNGLKGFFSDVPDYAKVKIKRVVDARGRKTSIVKISSMNNRAEIVKEQYIPVDVFDLIGNTEMIIQNIYDKYKFDFIYPEHSGFRSSGFSHDGQSMWSLIDTIETWFAKYKLDTDFLTGFMITTYED